ncbi:MAG: threonine dehydrogenase related Zn-dependent dehydrogenase [uncultured archaeon A07HB70]|nr:MAG: threonine dehydrogenase related Zn-dependent dehydrogenase [uncultured archaeon A07HB70]
MPARALYFTGERSVELRDHPVPTPDDDEVRVRTRVSAVSPGTELLVYRDEVPGSVDLDERIPALSGGYPLRYGYAAVGEVTATGGAVDDAWRGRRVFAFHPHDTHFCLSPDELVPVPDGVGDAAATLLPTAETAVTVGLDAAPAVGERAVVFGQGLVGLATTALLAAYPLDALVAVDPQPERQSLAAAHGATETDPPADVRDAFDPSGPGVTGRATDGADLAVELSGNPAALDDAVAVTGYDGRVLVGSWYGTKRADLDLGGRFHRSRVSIESTQVSTIDPARRGRWSRERRIDAAWTHVDRLDADSLLAERVSLEDASAAYRRLDGPDSPVGVLLDHREVT